MLLLGHDPYRSTGAAVFLALWMTLGHGSYQDMGNMPGGDGEHWRPVLVAVMGAQAEGSFSYDLAGMALRYGLGSAIMAAAFLSPLYALVGLAPAAVYAAAWAVWKKRPALFPTRGFIDGPTAPGELAIGAAFVGGLPLL
jgi:hypothetical protein